jgi:RNA polymerase sigma-54 factor
LAPLTLRDIANDLSIHESTVSRAAREKYVQTPHGIFELRSFFSSEVKTNGSRGISATSVKILIRELVEAEDRKQPLSDQAIADVLKWNQGIEISRRAIAKYRSELNIPSSAKRKQRVI